MAFYLSDALRCVSYYKLSDISISKMPQVFLTVWITCNCALHSVNRHLGSSPQRLLLARNNFNMFSVDVQVASNIPCQAFCFTFSYISCTDHLPALPLVPQNCLYFHISTKSNQPYNFFPPVWPFLLLYSLITLQ